MSVRDSFLDLERHRQLLEENIEKLRKSLRHWQTWEAEYEGLKEEILAADPPPNRRQLVTLAHGYEAELVKRKEVDDILGVETRDAAQVVNILDRRIDYVEQNVRTVQKQIEAAENKLAAATIVSTPDAMNEDGLPLTEIVEELDEEGNIVSSHTTTPGSAKPQLLDVLKKAGVEIPKTPGSELTSAKKPTSKYDGAKEVSPEVVKSTKKGVKFTEDTKSGSERTISQSAKRLEEIMKEAKKSEENPAEPPIIPASESAEDAALRRDMIQYGLQEVGAVVAELNIEDGSDWSDEEYEDAESSTDDEDEFGRSRARRVDDDLRQRMIALEERLGVRMMENIGKRASDYDVVQEGIGRITVNGKPDSRAKNSVRFSENLDVSPVPNPPPATPAPISNLPISTPVSDIVERTAPTESNTPAAKKRASRFKSERAETPTLLNGPPTVPSTNSLTQFIKFTPAQEQRRTVPSGPEGATLASTVIERDLPLDSAQAPDELDPDLLHQEVATEYHKMRNRMIQRQGGFMKEEESVTIPFTEEEGGPKKLSRFKAARLAKS
ncbi:hypothetical protein OIDMADRAFT_41430 [Oidiodendron maius Zn]|uniref:DUF3835 domain-containing protein n=1 Tax=Oidiodendron maius (strain Zn) TaxID=913774 RepID=A0A0C3DK04_OIDMZ|nr:hypothetical protein OIDMADRAFT_41430 [Oidiodendron maius Zn]